MALRIAAVMRHSAMQMQQSSACQLYNHHAYEAQMRYQHNVRSWHPVANMHVAPAGNALPGMLRTHRLYVHVSGMLHRRSDLDQVVCCRN